FRVDPSSTGLFLCVFFFFQAEDGIRDFHVTGVQTCALPICLRGGIPVHPAAAHATASVAGKPAAGVQQQAGACFAQPAGPADSPGIVPPGSATAVQPEYAISAMNLARLFRQRHAPRCGIPPQPIDDTPPAAVRWVLVDLETTGLDIYRDESLSIGPVTVTEGALSRARQFECTVYQPEHRPGEATLLHGIAPSQVRTGQPLGEALQDFMEYAGSCVMVAY